jgi:putative addiction module component (TIGR02574 family)
MLSELLELPAHERAALAIALWQSLSDEEHDAAFELSPETTAELERRLKDHLQRPESAVPWQDVRRKLTDRE